MKNKSQIFLNDFFASLKNYNRLCSDGSAFIGPCPMSRSRPTFTFLQCFVNNISSDTIIVILQNIP